MTWGRRPKELSGQRMGVILPSPRKGTYRHQTFRRQGGLCYYCGKPTLEVHWTIDHKQPRHKFKNHGAGHFRNKVGCCWTCNHAKGGMSEQDFINSNYLPQDRRILLGGRIIPDIAHVNQSAKIIDRYTRKAYWIRIGDGSLMRTIANSIPELE